MNLLISIWLLGCQLSNLNGPVPIGVCCKVSTSFSYSEGTIAIPAREESIAAKGSFNLNSTVLLSTILISTIGDTLLARGDAISLFCTLEIEDIISLASITEPS